jgi:hypothetical protein
MEFFSRRNYGVLADRRSYPRNVAMILHHLLLACEAAEAGDNAQLRRGYYPRAVRAASN